MTGIDELTPGVDLDEVAAFVALMEAAKARKVPGYKIAAVAEGLGSAVLYLHIAVGSTLVSPDSPTADLAGAVPGSFIDDAVATARRWAEAGIDVRSIFHSTYPTNLQGVFNKPPLVFVQGNWNDDRDSQSIAVVGTRKPTPQGVQRARRLTRELVEADFTIVSGLAAGVDRLAHETALSEGGRTVAVMGTGLGKVYPREHSELARAIVEAGGALITQFFPGESGRRWTFPARNITMSGLTRATVVVEAGETSGTRVQARSAMQHGRSVFFLRSLVEKQPWARELATAGKYGTQAIVIASTNDILARTAQQPTDVVLTG